MDHRTTGVISEENLRLTECVIYARVSGKKQLKGDGLNSQIKRCRNYAEAQGYRVLETFKEEAITGAQGDRPEMIRLLDLLDHRKRKPTAVIIDDIKRFARDVDVHRELKMAIYKRGGVLESPSFKFEDTPEGVFIETIMASAAELERNQNKRQVKNRMKARLENGYWTFNALIGLNWQSHPVHKKILVIDEALRPFLKEALEGFASNRFITQTDVVNFFKAQGVFGSNPSSALSKYMGQVNRMLRSPLYCGYIEYMKWGVPLTKGQHEGIISLEIFRQNQAKLESRPVKAVRQDTSADFILRNLVLCSECRRPLTASWSRGRSKKYPYYHCHEKPCVLYGKSIQRNAIEEDFTKLLKGLQASDEVIDLMRLMAEQVWAQRSGEYQNHLLEKEKRVKGLRKEIDNLADKLALATSEVAFKALERRMVDLSAELELLEPQIARSKKIQIEFGTAFSHVQQLLKNPYQTWKDEGLETKRLVTRMVFANPLAYDRETGFGTADLALPYLISQRGCKSDSCLVDHTAEIWNQFIDIILDWHNLLPITLSSGQNSVHPGLLS